MKPLYSNATRIAFRGKMLFYMPHRSCIAILHSIEIMMFPLSISEIVCFWSSKEPPQLIGPFKYQQYMFWLKNKKTNIPLRTLIWRISMRSRLTVR